MPSWSLPQHPHSDNVFTSLCTYKALSHSSYFPTDFHINLRHQAGQEIWSLFYLWQNWDPEQASDLPRSRQWSWNSICWPPALPLCHMAHDLHLFLTFQSFDDCQFCFSFLLSPCNHFLALASRNIFISFSAPNSSIPPSYSTIGLRWKIIFVTENSADRFEKGYQRSYNAEWFLQTRHCDKAW